MRGGSCVVPSLSWSLIERLQRDRPRCPSADQFAVHRQQKFASHPEHAQDQCVSVEGPESDGSKGASIVIWDCANPERTNADNQHMWLEATTTYTEGKELVEVHFMVVMIIQRRLTQCHSARCNLC